MFNTTCQACSRVDKSIDKLQRSISRCVRTTEGIMKLNGLRIRGFMQVIQEQRKEAGVRQDREDVSDE